MDISAKFIRTSIGSYEARLRYEEERALNAIAEHDHSVAAMAIAEAAKLKGAIDELEFLLDCMEVNNG